MNRYILVSYELQGKEGKIIVKEGYTEEEIKEFCVIDRLEKLDRLKLAKKVNLKKGEVEMSQGIELQEKYDELDNIVITLDRLIDETKDEYFLDMMKEVKYQAENERGEIQEEIFRQEEKELLEQSKEFEGSRL